jgi:hypothetical protein
MIWFGMRKGDALRPVTQGFSLSEAHKYIYTRFIYTFLLFVLTQHSIIGSDSGVADSRGGRDDFHLVNIVSVDENAGKLFIRGENDPVDSTDSETSSTVGYGVESVLDLQEFSRAAKGGEGKAVGRVSHDCC